MNSNILFFFSSTMVGGAETNIYKISKELVKLNYNVSWAYLEDTGPLLEKVDFDLKDSVETGIYYKNPISFYRKFKKIIQCNNIDIVLNFGLRLEIISRFLSKKLGAKYIISNIRSTDDWRKWYHVFLDRITQRYVDIWVSNSVAGKNISHMREKIDETKIEVIYNFFEEDSESNGRDETTTFHNDKIGILANITVLKGYYDLIALSKKLMQRNFEHTFFYGGADKTNGDFEETLKREKVDRNFINCGYVNDKEQFFSQFDIFLLPSYLEGMPTVLVEAMYHKKLIISTNVGGSPEIIHDKINGYLVAPGDVQSMADLIVGSNKNIFDSFNNASQKELKALSKGRIMKEWIKVFELLNKKDQ